MTRAWASSRFVKKQPAEALVHGRLGPLGGIAQASKALSVAIPKFFYALVVAFIVWKIINFWSGYYGMIEKRIAP